MGVSDRFLSYEANKLPHSRPEEPVRFVFVGTIGRFRNLERLVDAAEKLRRRTNRFCLHLVGPDVSEGFYHRLVKERKLEDVVSVKSPVPYGEVVDLLAEYDVGMAYVPARPTWDYQPAIKALEYRALGLPMISTNVASHREIVEDGVNGLLAGDTTESVAMAMYRLITDRPFLERCRVNAGAMRRGITWAEVARMYEQEVYEKLVYSGSPSEKPA